MAGKSMISALFPRFETGTNDIAAQFQPGAIAKLDRGASELGCNVNSVDVHAHPDRFHVDTVMALEIA